VPRLQLQIGQQSWNAIIDTGFNGDLELPDALTSQFGGVPSGNQRSVLAGGIVVDDQMYIIDFPFDGDVVKARVCYAPVDDILIGTGLLEDYLLEINFPARLVEVTRLRDP
jgi:predicted aspartyl protease